MVVLWAVCLPWQGRHVPTVGLGWGGEDSSVPRSGGAEPGSMGNTGEEGTTVDRPKVGMECSERLPRETEVRADIVLQKLAFVSFHEEAIQVHLDKVSE